MKLSQLSDRDISMLAAIKFHTGNYRTLIGSEKLSGLDKERGWKPLGECSALCHVNAKETAKMTADEYCYVEFPNDCKWASIRSLRMLVAHKLIALTNHDGDSTNHGASFVILSHKGLRHWHRLVASGRILEESTDFDDAYGQGKPDLVQCDECSGTGYEPVSGDTCRQEVYNDDYDTDISEEIEQEEYITCGGDTTYGPCEECNHGDECSTCDGRQNVIDVSDEEELTAKQASVVQFGWGSPSMWSQA